MILITHDAEVARHADRIVEFSDGRVVRDSGRKPDAIDPKRNAELAEALHEPARFVAARRFRRSDPHGDELAAREPVPHRADAARHRDRRRVGRRDARDRSGRAVGRHRAHQRDRHEHARASAGARRESTAQPAVDARVLGRGRDLGQRAERALHVARAAEQPDGALGQRGLLDEDHGDVRGADASAQLADGARRLLHA